eukprot:scaffold57038_cov54-Phaeocystis_antarctica.AAC.3
MKRKERAAEHHGQVAGGQAEEPHGEPGGARHQGQVQGEQAQGDRQEAGGLRGRRQAPQLSPLPELWQRAHVVAGGQWGAAIERGDAQSAAVSPLALSASTPYAAWVWRVATLT